MAIVDKRFHRWKSRGVDEWFAVGVVKRAVDASPTRLPIAVRSRRMQEGEEGDEKGVSVEKSCGGVIKRTRRYLLVEADRVVAVIEQ